MEAAAPTERVLLVDDEPVVLDALSRFLRRANFEIVEALRRRRDPIGLFVEAYGLTSRERDALVAAVHGLGNEEAATLLGVSKEALRKRWRHICKKTECGGQQRVLAKIIRELNDPP